MTPRLSGPRIALIPLDHQHAGALADAAEDGDLPSLKVTHVPDRASIGAYIERALAGEAEGTVMPFAIALRDTSRIIGSTRFWKIDRANRNCEIGHTWLAASMQRSFANTEAKFLMLQFAFESLHCVRVQFTTDVLNTRSRAAILRLGAIEEGTIRNERIMPDGRVRNSVRYSIIDAEWPAVRDRLLARLDISPAEPTH